MHLPVFSQIEDVLIALANVVGGLIAKFMRRISYIESTFLRVVTMFLFGTLPALVAVVSMFVIGTVHSVLGTVHDFIATHIAVLRQDIVDLEARL